MPDLDIKSETIDKAIDIITDSTKETRNALDTNSAKGINKFFELLKSTPVGIKIDSYIAERPYKLEQEMKRIKEKYENIPEENRVEPSSYIALKGANELNYVLDEEHLKEMFENLLVSDMDSRKQNKVHPSYIEIIKQLSADDAQFLKQLHHNKGKMYSISLTLTSANSSGYIVLDNYVIYNYKNRKEFPSFSTQKLNSLVIDNLIMHRLIEVNYDIYYENAEKEYESLFNNVKTKYKIKFNDGISYEKGYVKLTDLGKNFIDICLS